MLFLLRHTVICRKCLCASVTRPAEGADRLSVQMCLLCVLTIFADK